VTLSVPRGVAMWLANGLACLLDIGENPRAVGVILSEFSCNDRGHEKDFWVFGGQRRRPDKMLNVNFS
jgi:hypothetical protein